MLTAETISVGTELLHGNAVNTNAAFLAREFFKYGYACNAMTVVGDDEKSIKSALAAAVGRSDIVVITGGMGPTPDDITKQTVADFLGLELVDDTATEVHIRQWFSERGLTMEDRDLIQAKVPAGAVILENANGTAPGLIIEKEIEGRAHTFILMPGPPFEMEPMWREQAVSCLKEKNGSVIVSSLVKICGRTEAEVADLVDEFIRGNESGVSVSPHATAGEVQLRITATGEDEKQAKKAIKPVVKEIKARLGDSVYTTHEEKSLEEVVVELLLANKLTVTTVESCTGGLLAGRIINVPGVSEIYKAGYITYSKKAKRRIVGVSRKTLDKYGAVSEQAAREMVKGVTGLFKADVAVAVSGNAGPDMSEGKPVGLVYIAVNVAGNITAREYHFNGSRAQIREMSVASALILLRHCVLEYYGKMTFGTEE